MKRPQTRPDWLVHFTVRYDQGLFDAEPEVSQLLRDYEQGLEFGKSNPKPPDDFNVNPGCSLKR